MLGFLFFYRAFYYYAAPVNSPMSSWLMVLLLVAIGVLAGYLFPEQKQAMLMSVLLPAIGSLFALLIFLTPALSRDIVIGNLSDSAFLLFRYLLPDLLLSFIVMFITTFVMVTLGEEYGGDGQAGA